MRCRWAELVSRRIHGWTEPPWRTGSQTESACSIVGERLDVLVRNTRRFLMSNYTHKTAPTQFVEAACIRFAYRRFGAKIDIPLLFFMHFSGTMDHWDPAVTDGFGQDREVILSNNAGVSSSRSEVTTSIEEMAQQSAAFIDALGVKKLDALGFSIGGFVAQQFTVNRQLYMRTKPIIDHHEGGLDNEHLYSDDSSHSVC